jgi:hypothetical protein
LIDALDKLDEPLDVKMEKASLQLLSGNPNMDVDSIKEEMEEDEGMEMDDYEKEDDNHEEEEEDSLDYSDKGEIMPTTSNGMNDLYDLAQKLSGNFTVAPAQRTNWSRMVYESKEDGLAIKEKPNMAKEKTFGGGLFKVSTDVVNSRNKIFLKDKV